MTKRMMFDTLVGLVALLIMIVALYLTKYPPIRTGNPFLTVLAMVQFQQKFIVGVVSNRLVQVDRSYAYLGHAAQMKPADKLVHEIYLESVKRRALSLYHQGLYSEVINVLGSLLDNRFPLTEKTIDYHLLFGMALQRANQPDRALILAERLATIFPKNIYVIIFFFRTQLSERTPVEVYEALTAKQRRLIESNVTALLTVGDLSWNSSDYELASRFYRLGLELKKGHPAFLYRVGCYEIRVRKNLAVGLQYYKKALLRDPTYPGLQRAYWSLMTQPIVEDSLIPGSFCDSINSSLTRINVVDTIGILLYDRRALNEDIS